MVKRFTYTGISKIYKRKAYTWLQKAILSSLWIFVSVASIAGIIYYQANSQSLPSYLLYVAIFLPLIIAFIITFFIAINPKGAEVEITYPPLDFDIKDTSILRGTIKTKFSEEIEVEIVVPNVYGTTINLMSNIPENTSGDLSLPEMQEMGLEEIQKEYPGSTWLISPEIITGQTN